MTYPNSMFSRRAFLASTTASVFAVATTTACQDAPSLDRQLVFASLDQALRELDRLTQTPTLKSVAAWTLPQTLVHCAQSIEFSMTGFPESKSPLFQATVGALAFKAFAWRGRMRHDLAEPIPGAPTLAADTELAAGLARLRRAVETFHTTTTPLRPHFAYGDLSKSEYEQAHAMRRANHFSAFDIR